MNLDCCGREAGNWVCTWGGSWSSTWGSSRGDRWRLGGHGDNDAWRCSGKCDREVVKCLRCLYRSRLRGLRHNRGYRRRCRTRSGCDIGIADSEDIFSCYNIEATNIYTCSCVHWNSETRVTSSTGCELVSVSSVTIPCHAADAGYGTGGAT